MPPCNGTHQHQADTKHCSQVLAHAVIGGGCRVAELGFDPCGCSEDSLQCSLVLPRLKADDDGDSNQLGICNPPGAALWVCLF